MRSFVSKEYFHYGKNDFVILIQFFPFHSRLSFPEALFPLGIPICDLLFNQHIRDIHVRLYHHAFDLNVHL